VPSTVKKLTAANGTPVDVIYLDFSKAFNLFLHTFIVVQWSNLVNILYVLIAKCVAK